MIRIKHQCFGVFLPSDVTRKQVTEVTGRLVENFVCVFGAVFAAFGGCAWLSDVWDYFVCMYVCMYVCVCGGRLAQRRVGLLHLYVCMYGFGGIIIHAEDFGCDVCMCVYVCVRVCMCMQMAYDVS
jgi:hypothetical protein